MIKQMLSIVKKHGSGQVGGESTRDAPIYGEIKPKSIATLASMMMKHCYLSPSSIIVDVGSGKGK